MWISLNSCWLRLHGGQTDVWEIGRFSMKNKTVCGKTLMNSQKLKGESTRNILLNYHV